MDCRYRISLILSLIALCLSAAAQNNAPRFTNLTTEDGLADNTVYDIHQDCQGYMWFATDNGLSRYDGVRFQNYKNDPDDSNSLLTNESFDIESDCDGNIYVLGSKGVTRFNTKLNQFMRLESSLDDSTTLPVASVVGGYIYLDKQGLMWVSGLNATNRGIDTLYAINPLNGEILKRVPSNNRYQTIKGNFWEDLSQNLFFEDMLIVELHSESSKNKVDFLDKIRSQPFQENYNNRLINEGDKPTGYSTLLQGNASVFDHRGYRWLGSQDGDIFCLLFPENKVVIYSNPSTQVKGNSIKRSAIFSLYHDPVQDLLFIGQYSGGVLIVDLADETQQFAKLKFDDFGLAIKDDFRNKKSWKFSNVVPTSLGEGVCTRIFNDKSGCIWISIYGRGIYKYASQTHKFHSFKNIPFDSTTLLSNKVQTVLRSKAGVLYVGTDVGFQKQLSDGTWQDYKFSIVRGEREIKAVSVRAFTEDDVGNVYVGTYGYGLFKLGSDDKLTSLPFDNTKELFNQPGSWINDLHFDEKLQRIHISSWGHKICYFDINTKKIYGLSSLFLDNLVANHWGNGIVWPDNAHSLVGSFSHQIESGPNHQLWFSNNVNEPLYLLDQSSYRIKKSFALSIHADSLKSTIVNHFMYDGDSNLWVATHGGLSKYLPAEDKWVTYGTKQGLPTEKVTGIIADDNGYLWLTTSAGLVKVAKDSMSVVRIYTKADGLPSNDLTSLYQDEQGTMYVTTHDGLVSFNPTKLKENPFLPSPLLSMIEVGNRQVDADSLAAVSDLKFDPDGHDLKLYFGSDGYNLPEKNQYMVKLVGYDQDWAQLGNQPTTSYTNLPMGNYVLMARAANMDGLWGEEKQLLAFKVLPRWYEMLAVRAALVLLSIFIIYLIMSYFNKQKIAQLKEKQLQKDAQALLDQKLADERYNNLVAQLKTHDISNKILTMRNLVNDRESIRFVEDFAARTRKNMSAAHLKTWSISEELDCIKLDLALYNANTSRPVRFELLLAAEINPETLMLPPLSLQPYVENALKHGLHHLEARDPQLTLEFTSKTIYGHECVEVFITDNGVGRKRAQEIQLGNRLNNSISSKWGSYSSQILKEVWDRFNEGITIGEQAVQVMDLNDEQGHSLGTRIKVVFKKNE